jgi:uroporphyrinogen decarboxylase
MNGRQRVLTALDGGTPDRIPVALGFRPADLNALAPPGTDVDGLIDVEFVAYPPTPADEALRQRALPHSPDTRLGTPEQAATYALWDYHPEHPRERNPLARATCLADIESFDMPTPSAPADRPRLRADVAALHARGLAAGGSLPHLGGELFESSWRLRGLENLLLDMVERPAWVDALVARMAEFARANALALAQAGVDVLALDDDVGSPSGLLLSPTHWRRYFRPHLERIIADIREARPDIRLLFHSDGDYTGILDDLVALGFDAINPVQPDHVNPVAIRRRYGTRLALWGTVGYQTTLALGTPEEVRAEVIHRIATLGPSALVLAPCYDLHEPRVPWENLQAFFQTARDRGQVR